MPPWAYAVVGGGGVISLLIVILVIRAAIGGLSAAFEARSRRERARRCERSRPSPRQAVAETTPGAGSRFASGADGRANGSACERGGPLHGADRGTL